MAVVCIQYLIILFHILILRHCNALSHIPPKSPLQLLQIQWLLWWLLGLLWRLLSGSINITLVDNLTPLTCLPPRSPQVSWLLNGEPLVLAEHMALLSDGRSLEIRRAQEADTARYTCIASNQAGELQQNFHLQILGEC